MPLNSLNYCALIGSTLIALLLNGSNPHPAVAKAALDSPELKHVTALNEEGKLLYRQARYGEARSAFISAARLARSVRDNRSAAMNWSNAGMCSLATMQFGEALKAATEAKRIAESSGEARPLLFALNTLASLYLVTGQPENAIQIARQALNGPVGHADETTRGHLFYQLARSLTELNRFDEAAHDYSESIDLFLTQGKLDEAARVWGEWGSEYLRTGRLDEAEGALSEALRLVRVHRLTASANLLSALARLQSLRHRPEMAARLFDAALAEPRTLSPRWKIYSDRGQFRLDRGDEEGALADFREASRIAAQVRAGMVPADQDRVAWESGIGRFLRGLVDAGNRVGRRTHNPSILSETFDAAEQDRIWSLRLLVPGSNDWRDRLPPYYWELLARYQALQRKALVSNPAQNLPDAAALRLQLQQIEAEAGRGRNGPAETSAESTLTHVRSLLPRDTVLFSFHITPGNSWVWAVDSQGVQVFPLPPVVEISRNVTAFTHGLSPASGRNLYQSLFGTLPPALQAHSHWLLELDGPLDDVPFAALVTGSKGGEPVFLVEHATLQIIPGALLLEKRPFRPGGGFVGIADPVYNAADERFRGPKRKPEFSLPRLPNTSRELAACSRVWGDSEARVLTGMDAGLDAVRQAAEGGSSVLHFATHVVTGAGEYRSGLIALSLSSSGAMGLLGPREILARPVPSDLVVMNGCHSAQGESVPGSGRMGLTRAWIGAGAGSVLATQWDIPDDDAQSLITTFYRALRNAPQKGIAAALRESQLSSLRVARGNVGKWAGYYLLSRAL